MLKVNVKKKDLDDFTRALAISGTSLDKIIEEAAPAVGEVASRIIMGEMGKRAEGNDSDANFWRFMAARTAINVSWSNGTVILTIEGLTEGEVPNAADSRSGGKNVNENANLWARHEFGAVFDASEGKLVYTKDIGGITVVRNSKSGGSVSKRTGSVNKLISSLRSQIETSAVVLAAITASTATADVIEAATSHAINIDKSADVALKRAGVSQTLLTSMGVSNVKTSPRGQILLMGKSDSGSVRFIGGKEFGIPTTINR